MRAAVLIVNGLQPAYLGAYGCEWVPTPTIDRWAAHGVVFDNHFSDLPTPAAARQACWGRGNEVLAQLRAAGVKTAFVGPATVDAAAFDVRLTTKRESGPTCSARLVRNAIVS